MTFQDATRLLVSKVPISDVSRLYGVASPFQPGTGITIKPDFGEAIVVHPSQATYFFFIDDAPTMRFAHPVRYVLVDASGGVGVYPNKWLPTVNGQHWQVQERVTIDTVQVTVLREAVKAPAGPSPSGTPTQPGKTSRTLSEDLLAFARNLVPWRVASAQPGPKRIAVVVDGGERGRDYREDVAQQFAKDADDMAATLRQLGYNDTRLYSGYKGNTLPSVGNSGLKAQIARIANEVRPGDEVTLYLGGHGDKTGFGIYTRQGEADWLEYAELADWLKAIDTWVRVIVIIDACEAGGAVKELKARPNTVISPAADDKTATPVGIGAELSFSEQAQEGIKGKAEDRNQDGEIDLIEGLSYASVRNKGGGVVVSVPPPALVATPPVPVAPPVRPVAPPTVAPPAPAPPPPPLPPPLPRPSQTPRITSTISPAGGLTGIWRGGISNVDYWDPPLCQRSYELTLDLRQVGNDLRGIATAKYQSSKKLHPYEYRRCDPHPDSKLDVKGTVSANAFQLVIGETAYSGSFTTDLMRGATQSSDWLKARSCFQVGRAGAIAGCEPPYEKTPVLSATIDSASCSVRRVRDYGDYHVVVTINASGTVTGRVGSYLALNADHSRSPKQVTVGWSPGSRYGELAHIRAPDQPPTATWSARYEFRAEYEHNSSEVIAGAVGDTFNTPARATKVVPCPG